MPLPGLLLGGYYDLYVLLLAAAVRVAVVLATLVALDRIVCVAKYCFVCARTRVTGRAPKDAWAFPPLPAREEDYPMVAVQLPMFNERAVCQSAIDCAAELAWPASRLYVQVLDDSTDAVTRRLVDGAAAEWRERGVAVDVLRRSNRAGYKAGAMREGQAALRARDAAYVAVFDADFRPAPDFLARTVPYLAGNPALGYVQARWVFANAAESALCKAQELSLNYHMRCEQATHSAFSSFWNFNGTAGVWRAACVDDAGGWNARTTVEDMDLSLRAHLRGWRALFLDDVTCVNELPASFFAYRKQQHRWTCGPVQLALKAGADIARAPLPLGRRAELLLLYFGVRKLATHAVALGFFCALVPLTVFTPEVSVPAWALVHVPAAVTLSTAAFTPRGWAYALLYVLFENAMGLVKAWAALTGLLGLGRAQEWVVTTKLGSSDARPGTAAALAPPACRAYAGELGMALFLLAAAAYGAFTGLHWGMVAYLLAQGLTFGAFGLNMVDVGGALGGRLDEGLFRAAAGAPKRAALPAPAGARAPEARPPAARAVKRAATIPVIALGADARDKAWAGAPLRAPGSPRSGASSPSSGAPTPDYPAAAAAAARGAARFGGGAAGGGAGPPGSSGSASSGYDSSGSDLAGSASLPSSDLSAGSAPALTAPAPRRGAAPPGGVPAAAAAKLRALALPGVAATLYGRGAALVGRRGAAARLAGYDPEGQHSD